MTDEARPTRFDLRSMPGLAKIGMTALLIVMAAGFAASASHLHEHHEGRDERAGFTIDDIRGAYHGLRSEAPLRRAMEAGHPADIDDATPVPDEERQVLLDWLRGDRISEDYDDLDLGDMAPAEIIATNCLECHSRQAGPEYEAAQAIPLDYFDDVKKVAFSREINPNPPEIVITSLHTHALSLATLSIVVSVLLLATRWPAVFVGLVIALTGVALLADVAGQYFARSTESLVWLIAVGGAVYVGASSLSLLMVLADMWLPAGRRPRRPDVRPHD
ncbi:MAG: hypothetical protein GY715_12325 [Planctomycetes bacterium]|nr:hypothetical protein [Planctomycetota bacterium]